MREIIKQIKKAGVVVLYNPEKEIWHNVYSYSQIVEKLFIVDNSEIFNQEKADYFNKKKFVYIFNGVNKGIAAALNIATKKAIEENFDFLLTMDQDSSFINNEIAHNYGEVFYHIDNLNKIAIISLSTRSKNKINNDLIRQAKTNPFYYEEQFVAITSGSWINLKLFKKIGLFNESLFIDAVDYDYCLRAHLLNYRIVCFKNLFIQHCGGTPKVFLNRNIPLYSPIRIYYIIRNHFYLWFKYFNYFPKFVLKNIYSTIFIFLPLQIVFNKERIKIIIFMLKGFKDFLFNKYGKYGE
jgi:rhamnosyltransferase